ncbi:MAG: YlbF family regulator [Blautia sp.]|nr:YlbF family regulator [Blautia sp.]MDY3999950.1 YlbF family regulator [Blautia sp.]
MEAVNKNIKVFLSLIKKTNVYKEYKKQEEILSRNPELLERVDQFRANNFQIQNEAGSDNLFHVAEQLCRESAELRRYPEVNAFLDAELALCKMMQNICRELVEGIDVHMPNL